jgi:hypothetical protein
VTYQNLQKAGHIRIFVYGKSHKAAWRVVGSKILVTAPFGQGSAALGALAKAPATAACEKLREMVASLPTTRLRTPPKSANCKLREVGWP